MDAGEVNAAPFTQVFPAFTGVNGDEFRGIVLRGVALGVLLTGAGDGGDFALDLRVVEKDGGSDVQAADSLWLATVDGGDIVRRVGGCGVAGQRQA